MRRPFIYLILLALLFFIKPNHVLSSQTPSQEKQGQKTEEDNPGSKKTPNVKWYQYDDGLAKAKKENKHMMVFFYTTSCGWCKKMDRNTFGNEEVKEVLNESYVPVKVNGLSARKVKLDGEDVTERQLAGKYRVRAYPITWFLTPSSEKIAPRLGYASPEEFVYILNWVKDDLYEKISFQEFVKQEQENEKSEEKKD
jgi:thioredoxin-related protein